MVTDVVMPKLGESITEGTILEWKKLVGATIGKDESLSVIGIRTSTYKYFRGRKKTSNNVFLFNLKNDPLEEINLANKNPEIIEEMEKTLISINENNFNQIKTTKLTEDEKNKVELELRRLGYI